MTQKCQVCDHPNVKEIERQIVSGKNLSKLSKDYKVSYNSMYNHSQHHVTRQMATAQAQKQMSESMHLLERIDDLIGRTENIFQRNYDKKKDGMALKAIAEQRQTFELLCKISAYMHEHKRMELEEKQLQYGDKEEQEQEKNVQALFDEAEQKLNKLEQELFFSLLSKVLDEEDFAVEKTTEQIINQFVEFKPKKLDTAPFEVQDYEVYKKERKRKRVRKEQEQEKEQEKEPTPKKFKPYRKTIPSMATDDPATKQRVRKELGMSNSSGVIGKK